MVKLTRTHSFFLIPWTRNPNYGGFGVWQVFPHGVDEDSKEEQIAFTSWVPSHIMADVRARRMSWLARALSGTNMVKRLKPGIMSFAMHCRLHFEFLET